MSNKYIQIDLKEDELTEEHKSNIKLHIYKKLTNLYDPTYTFMDIRFDRLFNIDTNTEEYDYIMYTIDEAYDLYANNNDGVYKHD